MLYVIFSLNKQTKNSVYIISEKVLDNVGSKSAFREITAKIYHSLEILLSPFKTAFWCTETVLNWCRMCLFVSLYDSSFNLEGTWFRSSEIKVGYIILTFFINQTWNPIKNITGFFDETYFPWNNVIWCCSVIFNFKFSFFWWISDLKIILLAEDQSLQSSFKGLQALQSLERSPFFQDMLRLRWTQSFFQNLVDFFLRVLIYVLQRFSSISLQHL